MSTTKSYVKLITQTQIHKVELVTYVTSDPIKTINDQGWPDIDFRVSTRYSMRVSTESTLILEKDIIFRHMSGFKAWRWKHQYEVEIIEVDKSISDHHIEEKDARNDALIKMSNILIKHVIDQN